MWCVCTLAPQARLQWPCSAGSGQRRPPPSSPTSTLARASRQKMSSTESLTQKWLRQNIATYNDGNRVFADVDSTLSLFPTLRPKTEVYSSVTCPERPFDPTDVSSSFHCYPQPMTTVALNFFFASMACCQSPIGRRDITSPSRYG